MLTQEQHDEIKRQFPNGPKDKEEHAKFHLAIYKFDNELIHMTNGSFISIVYPATHGRQAEVYVFESPGEIIYTLVDLDNTEEEMMTITKKEYERLLERDEWLSCLEAAGVDNWENYSDAYRIKDGEEI